MTKEETKIIMKDRLRTVLVAGMAAMGETMPENIETFIDVLGTQMAEDRYNHQIAMAQVGECIEELQNLYLDLQAKVKALEDKTDHLTLLEEINYPTIG